MLGLGLGLHKSIVKSSTFTGVLDSFTRADVLYADYRFYTAYTGGWIRVRRSSDNAQQEILFNEDGSPNTAALATFCSGTDGFIVIRYNQGSLSDADFTQSSPNEQPKIYDSVTGVMTKNSIIGAYFDGVNDEMESAGVLSSSDFSIISISSSDELPSLDNQGIYCGAGPASSLFHELDGLDIETKIGSATIDDDHNYTTADTYIISSMMGASGGVQYINGVAGNRSGVTPVTQSGSVSEATQYLGSENGQNYLEGYIHFLAAWQSDQSANRVAMTTAINDLLNIY